MNSKFIFKLFNALLFLVITISQSLAAEGTWKAVEEGFVKKDEKYFAQTPHGTYLPIQNFNAVFPLATAQRKTLQMFVSQVLVRLDPATIGWGSATVVKSDGYTFEAVSAKHNFMNRKYKAIYPGQYLKSVEMFQGQGLVDDKTNYLSRGVIEEICSSERRDIALIKGRYEDGWSLPNREQRQLLKSSVATLCNPPTMSPLGVRFLPFRDGFLGSIIDRIVNYPTAYIFGYPAGVSDQRVRSGLVFSSPGRHEISTLPGDSGAGLFHQANGSYHLFGIHTGGSEDYAPVRSVKVEFPHYRHSFKEYKYNQFHVLTLGNLKEEFSKCVKISRRPLTWRLQHGISNSFDRFK